MILTSRGSNLGFWTESEFLRLIKPFPPSRSASHRGLIRLCSSFLVLTMVILVALPYARRSCLQPTRPPRQGLCSTGRSRMSLERSVPNMFGRHFRSPKE